MYMKNLQANLFMGASAYDHRPVSLDRKTLGKGICWGTERNQETKKETKKQNPVKLKDQC